MPIKIHGRECSPSYFKFVFPGQKCTFIPVLNFIFYVSYCHYIWVHLLSTFLLSHFQTRRVNGRVFECFVYWFCPFSTISTLDFWNSLDGVVFFIFILYINSSSHNRNLQHGYLDKNKSLKMPVIRNRIL